MTKITILVIFTRILIKHHFNNVINHKKPISNILYEKNNEFSQLKWDLKNQNIIVKMKWPILKFTHVYQARNLEFFRAGKFSWNQGTSIDIHLQHEAPQGKHFLFFTWKVLKILFKRESLPI